jgi:hypothetical protein
MVSEVSEEEKKGSRLKFEWSVVSDLCYALLIMNRVLILDTSTRG